MACGDGQSRREEREREEEERDSGQKHHFIAVLSPPKPEINILIRLVSFSKFGTKNRVFASKSIFFGVRWQSDLTFSVR